MASKPPAPQAISALLRKAGSARSNYGDTGIVRDAVSTGYGVSGGAGGPEPHTVEVRHFDERRDSLGWPDEVERYLETVARPLKRYAEVIRGAGWEVEAALRCGKDPRLIVTTPQDQAR